MELQKIDSNELSKDQMNQIVGGVATDCITCTPKGNHTDQNDYEEEIKSSLSLSSEIAI